MDTKMAYKKKVSLSNLSDNKRDIRKQTKAINDGLTPQERRDKRIENASNGCWWVKQYIMGSYTRLDNIKGIDDE
jgi:hypothetical protein